MSCFSSGHAQLLLPNRLCLYLERLPACFKGCVTFHMYLHLLVAPSEVLHGLHRLVPLVTTVHKEFNTLFLSLVYPQVSVFCPCRAAQRLTPVLICLSVASNWRAMVSRSAHTHTHNPVVPKITLRENYI